MPFIPTNFANIAPQGNPAVRDLVTSLMQGYQASQTPTLLGQQEQTSALKNAFQGMLNQEQPQKFQSALKTAAAQQALAQAEAAKYNQQAKDPFGGQTIPGDIGQVLALYKVKQVFGENSPQYQTALSSFKASLNNKKANTKFKNVLSDTASKRYSSPLGKLYQEQDEDIAAGFVPGTNRRIPLTPEQQQQMQNAYGLKIQKTVTDTQARQRNLYATNIEKTLGMINPDDLVQYGGLAGQSKLQAEKIASALGHPSDNFIRYQKALSDSKNLADQIRFFMSASVTPSVREDLQVITNPASWINSPKVALAKFNEVKKWLGNEMGTYRGAVQSTKVYQGGANSANSANQKTLRVLYNGQVRLIPDKFRKEILAAGGKILNG